MRRTIIRGFLTIALLFARASRTAVLVSYGMDFCVTDVLRPQSGRGVFVLIAASSVNPHDTKIFGGAAAHARQAPRDSFGAKSVGRRESSKPDFNFDLNDEESDNVARSTCN
jgi:hypothetical protein